MRFSSSGSARSRPGEAAEGAEQLLGELQHAGAGEAGAQQQGDQLGVGERGRRRGRAAFRAVAPRRECP